MIKNDGKLSMTCFNDCKAFCNFCKLPQTKNYDPLKVKIFVGSVNLILIWINLLSEYNDVDRYIETDNFTFYNFQQKLIYALYLVCKKCLLDFQGLFYSYHTFKSYLLGSLKVNDSCVFWLISRTTFIDLLIQQLITILDYHGEHLSPLMK